MRILLMCVCAVLFAGGILLAGAETDEGWQWVNAFGPMMMGSGALALRWSSVAFGSLDEMWRGTKPEGGVTSIRLEESRLCINCDAITGLYAPRCPVCGSNSLMPINKWLGSTTK